MEKSIKLIGLGGIGGIVAKYLSIYLASMPEEYRLVFIDGDEFELKNASRMAFSNYGNKAEVIKKDIDPCLENTKTRIEAIDEYVTAENLSNLIHEEDVVFLMVDNHVTRKLVNDHCSTMQNVSLISGGNDGVIEEPSEGQVASRGSWGNCQVYLRINDKDASPSLLQYHSEIANPQDKHPDDVSCVEALLSTPQILFTNLAVASVILNTFRLLQTKELHYSEIGVETWEGKMYPIPIPAPVWAPVEELDGMVKII